MKEKVKFSFYLRFFNLFIFFCLLFFFLPFFDFWEHFFNFETVDMAIGSQEYNEELMIFQEALRYDLSLEMISLKEKKRQAFVLLDMLLRCKRQSGCYRNEIYDAKHVIDERSVIFTIDEDDLKELKYRTKE